MVVPIAISVARTRRRRPAFSLIELLVAVAVMTLLVSILLPSLNSAREAARRTVCLSNMSHVGVSLFAYAADNKETGPAIVRPMSNNRSPRTLLSVPDASVQLGRLWPRAVSDPRLFRCPSQRRFEYEDDPRGMGRDYVAGSYAYAVHIPAGRSPRLGAIRHLALAADDFVAGEDHVGLGRYSHRQGYNVLYADGSVSWYADPDESIWKRSIYWDDESDSVNYDSFYSYGKDYVAQAGGSSYGSGGYSRRYDVFKAWHSFCYQKPDPF